jgi:hypothetical protein
MPMSTLGIFPFLFTSTIPIHITPPNQCLKNVQTLRNDLKFLNHHPSATLTHISTFTRMRSTFQTQLWSTKHMVDEVFILLIFYKSILHKTFLSTSNCWCITKCYLMAYIVLQNEFHYWCVFVYNVHIWHLMPSRNGIWNNQTWKKLFVYIISPHEFIDVDVNCDTLGHQDFTLLKVKWLREKMHTQPFFHGNRCLYNNPQLTPLLPMW